MTQADAGGLLVFFYIPRQDMFMDQVIEYLVLQGTPVEATAERLSTSMANDIDNQGTTDGGGAGTPFATASLMSRNAKPRDAP